MRSRNLLILALVVAALGAFVWFFERKLPGTAEREALANRLFTIEADEVTEVVLEQPGRRVHLEREPPAEAEGDEDLFHLPGEGEWWIREPISWRADRWAVDDLIRGLVGLEKQRELDGVERADYGLEPSMLTATLVTADGARRVMEVGVELPGGAGRVVALADDPMLYVVPGAFYANLAREASEWRSRELFPAGRRDVERARLERGEHSVLLARRGEEHWIEAPVTDLAESDLVEGFLGALVALRVERFVDDPAAEGELGLDPPGGAVEVAIRGREEPFRIEWGGAAAGEVGEGEAPARYLRIGGQVVVAVAGFEEHLEREPGQWRSRRWATLAPYQIERAVFRDSGGVLELERRGADWRRGEETIAYGPVNDLLTTVSEARADRLIPGPQAARERVAAGEPMLTATLATAQGGEQTLQLFPRVEDGLPARASGREVVLLLPRVLGTELEDRLQAVRRAEASRPFEEEG